MKLLLFMLLAMATSVIGEYECTPDTFFKIDCNMCYCSNDGNVACTDMACPPKVRSSQNQKDRKCIPLTNFLLDCNTCYCTKRGEIGWCTLKSCAKYEGIITYLESPKVTRSEMCEPGSFFKSYCNSCKCSDDGKSAGCTLMACDKKVWNPDGTMKL